MEASMCSACTMAARQQVHARRHTSRAKSADPRAHCAGIRCLLPRASRVTLSNSSASVSVASTSRASVQMHEFIHRRCLEPSVLATVAFTAAAVQARWGSMEGGGVGETSPSAGL